MQILLAHLFPIKSVAFEFEHRIVFPINKLQLSVCTKFRKWQIHYVTMDCQRYRLSIFFLLRHSAGFTSLTCRPFEFPSSVKPMAFL